MKKQIRILIFVLGAAFLFFPQANAAISPIAIDIVPPLQFPPEDFSVTGLRVSALWGQHRNMYGIDIGALGNITELAFTGIAVAGGFNHTRGNTTIVGLQAAGITNINTNKVSVVGIQVAGGMNSN